MKIFLTAMLFLWAGVAAAHHHYTINYYEVTEVVEVTEVYTDVYEQNTTITGGVSDEELSRGLAAAAAVSSHHFDFGTFAWQASITGAWVMEESTDAISASVGKRFKGMDALWHGSVSRSGDLELLTVGATFRF